MKIPLFTIVGRVNVGKSTLFNAIIKKNIAVTHRAPGVTRDVIKKRVIYEGKIFEICDTGGLFGPENPFQREIEDKFREILESSDAFIFVVSAKEGLTEGDRDIFYFLKKKGKPIYLVINKIDVGDRRDMEFFELGVEEGRVFRVSSAHKMGIQELLDRIVSDFPFEVGELREDKIPVSIIGRPNVGKSSLLNAILEEDMAIVSEIPGTTRDPVEGEREEFLFIDTAGIRRKFRSDIDYFSYIKTSHSIDYSLCVIWVVSAEEFFTRMDKRIFSFVEEKGKGIVCAINKSDLISKKEREEIFRRVRQLFPSAGYVPFVFVSALRREGINTLLYTLKTVKRELYKNIGKKKLHTLFLNILREKPPPVPIFRIVEKSKIPRVFELYSKVEVPDYYIRFIKRKIRENFSLMGVPIKIVNRIKS